MNAMSVICRIPWPILVQYTASKTKYIINAGKYDFLSSDIEVSLEVLLETSIRKLGFEGSAVRQPVTKEQLAAVHAIVAGVFEVEDAHAGFFGREEAQELFPVPLTFS